MPSTQNPDAHAPLPSHTAPFGFGPQLPATHDTPVAQSAGPVHVVVHAEVFASHPNGAQIVSGPGRQRPSPSHTCVPVTAAGAHTPSPHITPGG